MDDEKSLEEFSAAEIESMAVTYKSLVNNPETRELVLRATKKINPALNVPELDLKDQARAAFKTTNDRMESLENEIRMRDARDRINGERSTLREQGFDKDAISAIEKIMTDEQIPNYATAAKYYANARMLAEPTPNAGGAQPGTTYDLPADALGSLKGGKGGLSKWARGQAEAAMAELKSGRVKLQ
jgi:hypothetical protein